MLKDSINQLGGINVKKHTLPIISNESLKFWWKIEPNKNADEHITDENAVISSARYKQHGWRLPRNPLFYSEEKEDQEAQSSRILGWKI